MINIFQNTKNDQQTFSSLLKSYYAYLKSILNKEHKYHIIQQNLEAKLKNINLNFRKLATTKFEKLLTIESKFNKANSSLTDDEKDFLYYLYEQIRQNFGYKIAEQLHIKSCPYCNINSINTYHDIERNHHVIEAQFDHFYPKSIHPLLSICFFNIIPICSYCNNKKSAQHLDYSPYISDPSLYTDDLIKFTYSYELSGEIKVNLQILNAIITSNVNILKLAYKYNSNISKDQALKAINVYTKYPNKKIESLKSLFSENFSDDTVNKILFLIENNYHSIITNDFDYTEQNYSEHSYSKLWHDIGKQITEFKN